jgi:hypothetical protein
VAGEICLPGDEFLEGVDIISFPIKVILDVEPHPVPVIRVLGELAVHDPDGIDGIIEVEGAAQDDVIPVGEDFDRRAIPEAAEVFFEEMDDAIDHALAPAARDINVP